MVGFTTDFSRAGKYLARHQKGDQGSAHGPGILAQKALMGFGVKQIVFMAAVAVPLVIAVILVQG